LFLMCRYNSQSGSYNNAREFFADQGFNDMRCLLFSFESGATATDNFKWDPIIAIDKNAARAATNSQSSSSSDNDDGDNVGLIVGVVVGGVVGLGCIFAVGFWYFAKRVDAGTSV
jgi:hypothetical protein